MAKQEVERIVVPLRPLPEGNESSLQIIDIVYDDGSVRRTWKQDDGVQVLGLTEDGQVIAVTERGYTHLVGGYVEPGEDPEIASGRELLEETGYQAGNIWPLPKIDLEGRVIHLYLATDCRKIQNCESEISVELMSPRQFWQHILQYMQDEPGTKRRGSNSLQAAVFAFSQLEMIEFIGD